MHDLLVKNANIVSMAGTQARNMAIKDGRVTYLGDQEKEAKEVLDLGGRTVIPGMADSHLHLYAHCQNLTYVDLAQVKSIPEMIEKMKEKAKETPPGQWIKGVNFDQTKWREDRFPTLEEMDSISTDHPLMIKRVCLHTVVANSKALEVAPLDMKKHAQLIDLDEDGKPNGTIREEATTVVDNAIGDPLADPEVRDRILKEVLADMSSKGITTIHTYAAQIWNYNEDINFYRDLEKKGELPLRVTVNMDSFFPQEERNDDDPFALTYMGAFKMFTDGSLGSNSAALFEPYTDDPSTRGILVDSEENLHAKIKKAYENGYPAAIHAIGDRALSVVLDGIEKTLDECGSHGPLPFRIIHAEIADAELIERMAKLPVVVDMQAIFMPTDVHWLDDKLGERAKIAYPIKSMIDAGLTLTGGSDCPVETYEPVKGIYAAVTRQDLDGYPQGGFNPSERISVEEAVRIYTANVHVATGQEEVLGTLEEGMFADFVVLEDNIFEMPVEEIQDLKVDATYLAGRCVYKR